MYNETDKYLYLYYWVIIILTTMIYLPFICGGIALIFWGIKGALVGLIIGSIISTLWYFVAQTHNRENLSQNQQPNNSCSSSENSTSTNQTLMFRTMALIASVMKADGVILKNEVESIKPFLLNHYGIDRGKDALQILKHLLDTDINYIHIAKELKANLNYSSRLEMLHLLLTLSYADGNMASQEKILIVSIAISLGISEADYKSMCALFYEKTNSTWAYTALGLTINASNEEVKRAYHSMAMKYHPDKITGNEELKRSATVKFREIKDAYECIKRERNII